MDFDTKLAFWKFSSVFDKDIGLGSYLIVMNNKYNKYIMALCMAEFPGARNLGILL